MKTKQTIVSPAEAGIIGKKIGMSIKEFGQAVTEAVRVFRETRNVFDEFKKVKSFDSSKSKYHK